MIFRIEKESKILTTILKKMAQFTFAKPKTESSGEEFFTISFDELDSEEEINFFNQGDQ